ENEFDSFRKKRNAILMAGRTNFFDSVDSYLRGDINGEDFWIYCRFRKTAKHIGVLSGLNSRPFGQIFQEIPKNLSDGEDSRLYRRRARN
ncbi:hypothetical protein, partial [Blautia hydrogenotrophica]|uniref:hypothetical protein n=1 Tax=Blautia hydrogenotrophica TaxID=53443 RepID=UPI0023F3A6CF